jgi:uncharacterized Fe-S cluster-containing radical SAM superfamily protein
MSKPEIDYLASGGLITNYYCSSKCAHCLYRCTPSREKEYISKEFAVQAFRKIRSLGCYSVHIGGGEPFLNPESLLLVAEAAADAGMGIDYVETNSSWFQTEEKAIDLLRDLQRRGIRQLLISISPFHNVHIPFAKVKGVLKTCRTTGMHTFPWVMDFYSDIDAFDEDKTHSLEEYAQKYGPGYLQNIPIRYWTHFGGRAVETFKKILPLKPLEQILSAPPCREITDVSHFHIDLYGNYIPGLCTGFAIQMDDLGEELSPEKYPLLNVLYKEGIGTFCELAVSEYDFQPEESYLNKCDLCNAIRLFLVKDVGLESPELKPETYYQGT